MKTEILKIEQCALRCVEVIRTIYLEVPEGCRDARQLQREVGENEELKQIDFLRVEGTEYLEPLRLRVLGVAAHPIPVLGHDQPGQESLRTPCGELLGTCTAGSRAIVVYDGTPDFFRLLNKVTTTGFHRRGYSSVRGGKLLERLHQQQDDLIRRLPDDDLVALCLEAEFYRASAARSEWGRRIRTGNKRLFRALKAAAISFRSTKQLRRLLATVLAEFGDVWQRASES